MQTLIPRAEVNIEVVQKIFEAAMYPAELDDDTLAIGVAPLKVLASLANDSTLVMSALFRVAEEHSAQALYEACNAFNDEYLIAKAFYAHNHHLLFLETDINFEGGLTPMNVVMRARRLVAIFQQDNPLDPYL